MMSRNRRSFVIASLAAALLAGVPALLPRATAQDAPASTQPTGKATITVTVMDDSNSPVEGARVALMAKPTTMPSADTAGGGGGGGGYGGQGSGRPKPLARGTTDSTGKATMANIADGDYTVTARLRGKGNGKQDLTIASGADAAVSITLKPRGGGHAAPPATQPQ